MQILTEALNKTKYLTFLPIASQMYHTKRTQGQKQDQAKSSE